MYSYSGILNSYIILWSLTTALFAFSHPPPTDVVPLEGSHLYKNIGAKIIGPGVPVHGKAAWPSEEGILEDPKGEA